VQIQAQDPAAVQLLRLMAYLDNQDLWFELFKAGAKAEASWLAEVVESRARFSDAMLKLHDYSLVEAKAGSYSLHPCVHDWTLSWLNRKFDEELWRSAVHCIARSVKRKNDAEYWVQNRRLIQHAHRLEHNRLKKSIDWTRVGLKDLSNIALLYSQSGMRAAAEQMCMQALQISVTGEHTPIILTFDHLDMANILGCLYFEQGRIEKAEQIYRQALQRAEKILREEHPITLGIVNNLGITYADLGKTEMAEEMYRQALYRKEKMLGEEHPSTLATVINLGNSYVKQGKMEEAEQMYVRALQGYEKSTGLDHPDAQRTANNLEKLRVKVEALGKQGLLHRRIDSVLRLDEGGEDGEDGEDRG
jgi:tetratricopeptide (TPR) repeat protein